MTSSWSRLQVILICFEFNFLRQQLAKTFMVHGDHILVMIDDERLMIDHILGFYTMYCDVGLTWYMGCDPYLMGWKPHQLSQALNSATA